MKQNLILFALMCKSRFTQIPDKRSRVEDLDVNHVYIACCQMQSLETHLSISEEYATGKEYFFLTVL